MGDLSEHFSKSEFACKCGCNTPFTIAPDLIDALESIRDFVNLPLIITSGFRCPAHNAAVGGGPEHPAGKAADIAVTDDSFRSTFLDAATAAGIKRKGIASNFIHVGVDSSLPQNVVWMYPTK